MHATKIAVYTLHARTAVASMLYIYISLRPLLDTAVPGIYINNIMILERQRKGRLCYCTPQINDARYHTSWTNRVSKARLLETKELLVPNAVGWVALDRCDRYLP